MSIKIQYIILLSFVRNLLRRELQEVFDENEKEVWVQQLEVLGAQWEALEQNTIHVHVNSHISCTDVVYSAAFSKR